MTSTGERIQRGFLLPYAEIFRDHRARRFSAAGVIGRMPMAMLGLGSYMVVALVLLIVKSVQLAGG